MIENEISIDGRFQMRVNFNLKDTSRVGGKKSQIYLTTTINRERVRLFTGLSIEPEYWIKTSRTEVGERAKEDSSLGRVQLEYNKNINHELRIILGYCKEYCVEVDSQHLFSNKKIRHSKAAFEEFIRNKLSKKEQTVQTFIESYIERKKSMVNKDTMRTIGAGTIYNHYNVLNRLLNFCKDNRIRLTWDIFNNRFEERFTAWMNSKGYAANTIFSTFSIFKLWLSEAEFEGFSIDKSFHRFKTKGKDVDNIYLTEDEINRLYSIDFQSEDVKARIDPREDIEKTRDLFVFACWTGLRFGDFRNLSEAEISNDIMTVHTSKTNQTVKIPLHPMAIEILDKYDGHLPAISHKSRSLKHLRKCGEIAGLTERVSFTRVKGGRTVIKAGPKFEFIMNHTARRSFATNMYLRGNPPISIMAVTGHTTEANFMKYIKVSQEEHARIIAANFKNQPMYLR